MSEQSLLKVASDVAAMMQAIVKMSDDVTVGASPLDTQGRLLAMQSSLQKNKSRITTLINKLCDFIDAEKALSERPQ